LACWDNCPQPSQLWVLKNWPEINSSYRIVEKLSLMMF